MTVRNNLHLSLISILLFAGDLIDALPYDYTATIECLENPYKPLYKGGIIVNSELNDGLKGWSTLGDSKIEHRQSNGNHFVVVHGRNQPHDSVSQQILLQKNLLYTFSAWIQVSRGSLPVTAVFKTASGFKHAGAVVAKSGCWSMLKGGLTPNISGPAQLYFEAKNTSVEIWVDSISLQPFTEKQWRSHQDQSVQKARKANVRLQAVDEAGNPLSNATIIIEQKKLTFPFGCATNKNILTNTAYQKWFTSRFTVTTFENEMKWYSTEPTQWKVDYSVPDAMVNFAKQHNVAVRGHNVLWDDPKYQPGWVNSLSPADLSKAVAGRISSIMTKYRGSVIGWDVMNENLHFNFFESKLGPDASGDIYNQASKADGGTTLFLNDYNTIEDKRDPNSTPAKYLEKLKSIRSHAGNNNLHFGIGLESHFSTNPDLAYIRSSIDTLAATKFPIWLTEVDIQGTNQAVNLEQVLREAHSHPKVSGIVIWSAWSYPEGCYRMCLIDNNFKNLPTGDVVDKLLREWGGLGIAFEGTTDSNGVFEASLFHGEYSFKINHPSFVGSSSLTNNHVVVSSNDTQEILLQVSPSQFS